jgi:MFS family permease
VRLALAAVIPVTGWAARRLGASRLYLTALATFTIGSALCALSRSAGMLIACRVLQGAGGGAILNLRVPPGLARRTASGHVLPEELRHRL